MRQTILTLILCISSLCTMAGEQNRTFNICSDKIIINTDSLDMPKSTTAYEVLICLPELLERPSDYLFNNYTIQINGKTVGDARDAVLKQIRISDLRCIEVSDNSLSAISALGRGGSISLELRPAVKGLTGAVNTEVNSEADYTGGLRLDDRNDKWSFRGIATVENYVPRAFNSYSGNGSSSSSETDRFFTELVTTFTEYRPTARDLFKLNVSEVYTSNRQCYDYTSGNTTSTENSRVRNVNLFAGFNYEHTFTRKGVLSFEMNYRFTPEKYDDEYNNYNIAYQHLPHNVYGELKLKQPFIPATPTQFARMEFGVQYNYSTADNSSESYLTTASSAAPDFTLDVKEDIHYLRPFLKLEAGFKKWELMGFVDYQHYAYQTNIKSDKEDSHCDQNDITGQAVIMYSPDKRNTIRLRFDHNISRPTSVQLYPYEFNDPQLLSDINIMGNIDLVPTHLNAFDLDYDLNLSTEDYHLEMKAGVEYSHTYDVVNTYYITETLLSYLNNGTVDVVNGNIGFNFRKAFFSLWFSGNIYYNNVKNNDDKYKNTFYNLLLRPVFNLGRNWLISCDVTYNSPIDNTNYKRGQNFYGGIRVGKTWSHFNAYIYGKQNFIGKQKDINYLDNTTIYTDYIISSIGAGVRYIF